ncbi:hypothetical protein HanRHA438_Chr13g0588371 [Helianthus annuus]|uniref:Uncharacterized protein n=1 Tax=Helianthus annuus TaxID=4232 RepID=A0A9K3HA22_HELAN|nr:uncharacterized protein LOC110897899 [Helianthus annuus]KAF5772495.1 hypothetical protein HanXRQr2_Chr13g0577631 [Helianthus annuus]KAJ0476112.1 hypothetical protein HanHA300_Chr13g0473471 [Helianthus annuus]KAJ0480177.1 hypothetical protein HanIR_Chr13g0628571 [Helianthus annuus]KAJ0496916.1 hypothetical protein HanHA89_Chr13g0505361 [Helianthus annuus]KAJ0670453.1 hypothetical protein HanOQP8_Chr13g0474411 [Helianthus annuus]
MKCLKEMLYINDITRFKGNFPTSDASRVSSRNPVPHLCLLIYTLSSITLPPPPSATASADHRRSIPLCFKITLSSSHIEKSLLLASFYRTVFSVHCRGRRWSHMSRMKLLLQALGTIGRLVILMSFWMVIGIQVRMVGIASENDDEDRWLVFSGH